MIEKILLLIICVVLIICTAWLTRAISNQNIYMSIQLKDSVKLNYLYDTLKSADEVLITDK
jgi:hypothetical protein